MVNIYIVSKDRVVVGVYDAETKADTIAAFIAQPGARVSVEQRESNYAYAEINAGNQLFVVAFSPVTSTAPNTTQPGLETGLEEGHFQYDSRTRRYRVAIFAANQAAAEAEAETLRAAFVTANGL